MDIKDTLTEAIQAAAKAAIADGVFPEAELADVVLEVPPKKEFGDFSTNFAMQSARVFHKAPRQIAEELQKRLAGDWLDQRRAHPGRVRQREPDGAPACRPRPRRSGGLGTREPAAGRGL